MRRVAFRLVIVLAAVGAASFQGPGSLSAQQVADSDCALASYRVLSSQELRPGQRITSVGHPDVVCEDGTRLLADSAVIHHGAARYELIGNVRYEAPERELQATLVDYFERDERIFARGSVELRDREQGSEVRGDTLVLLFSGPLREQDDFTVWGDRASALLPPEEGAGAAEPGVDPALPYRVVARWMRFEGDRLLRAEGEVEVDRDGMQAFSELLTFDRESGDLALEGDARLETEDGTFAGETIHLVMPDDELESITVRGHGRLVAEDLEVLGEEIRVSIREERIQRLVSVDRGRGDTTADAEEEEAETRVEEAPTPEADQPADRRADRRPRPQAITEEFFLTGDSIDVHSPDEALETIFAVGAAWGETRPAGTPPPGPWIRPAEREIGAGEGAGVLDRDWIVGDTIVATFVPAPPSEAQPQVASADVLADPTADPDSEPDTRREYVLDRLVATGSAAAFHRSPPEERSSDAPQPTPEERDRWAISYVLADEILVALQDGRMDRVEADGNVRGAQLEPIRPDPPADEPEADTPADGEEPA